MSDRLASLAIAVTFAAGACTSLPEGDEYRATIRRTSGGIPHVEALDFGGIGFGTLYAMAEDNVCLLADQYLTLGARRSAVLGPEEGNVESDLFYQYFIDLGEAEEPLPPEMDELYRGAAVGYNHYLRSTDLENLPDPRCRGAAWLGEIDTLDVKRVSRVDYALAYMLPLLIEAAPPQALDAAELPAAGSGARGPDSMETAAIETAAAVAAYLEVPKQGGSNAIAIGRDVSRGARGMLLANPHMPWNQPFQRFYPMHQTIPGRFDALGANLIGRPRVGFGFNENVAWTNTVSTAKRASFYRLELVPGDPTSYVFDGVTHPMETRRVTVRVKTASGVLEERSHIFYTTHFGGRLVEGDFFPWTNEHAFAVRMPDAGWRGEASALAQLTATSVRELKGVHDRYQFLPVNLIAADSSGEVLYADPGPIPNLSDQQLADCAVLRGAAYDGSRSQCQWGNDPDAVAPGIFGPARLPFIYRSDYVTNSNDSYWLTNPAAPLTGFPHILGTEAEPRTLRTRSGLEMVGRYLSSRISLDELREITLANESYAGALLRDDVVALCRANPDAVLADGRELDLRPACEVLAAWDLHANLGSRGAHLFRELMSEANAGRYERRLPASFRPRVPFDAANPIATPSGLDTADNPTVLVALAKAVSRLQEAGIALDAPLGELQHVTRNDEMIPLHGGPESEGIFNKIEARFQGAAGYPDVTAWSSSWILAVAFTDDGPHARGILTYSLSSNPSSPHYDDQTRMYSGKRWLELPFRAADVEAAALRKVVVRASR